MEDIERLKRLQQLRGPAAVDAFVGLLAYWLIVGPRNTARPEVQAFCDWLKTPAAQTFAAIGETQTAPPAAA